MQRGLEKMPENLEALLDIVESSIEEDIPYYFRCPISLHLMRDPVILSTGQTYDRSSIRSWIAAGNSTCPVTRTVLTDSTLSTLIPNHTLRRLIHHWCLANKNQFYNKVKQIETDPVVMSLLTQFQTESNSVDLRRTALKRLRKLARDSEGNKAVISTAKTRGALISVVFGNLNCGCDLTELTHESLAILSLLQLSESECLFVASDLEKVNFLVKLLFHSSIYVRANSAALIENIVAGTRSSEIRSNITGIVGIFDGVIGILNHQISNPRALKVGIKALFALCLVKHHRHAAVTAGAVDTIIHRLPEFDKSDVESALATVELICQIPSGCEAFAAHALTVPLLVKIILSISNSATEYAVEALLSLCSSSEQCRRDSVAADALTRLLLLMQSECTQRAKRKAQLLLKLLQDSWLQHPIANSDNFGSSVVVSYRVLVYS